MSKPPEYNYLLPPKECEVMYRILGRKPTMDPCGHPDQFLEADKIYYGTGTDDDGMLVPWTQPGGEPGFVVLNASHGERAPKVQPNFAWYPLSRWIMKASAEAQKGSTIIAPLPANTDRTWFHAQVTEYSASICFLEKRLKFFAPDYETGGPPKELPQPMVPHMYVLWTKDKDVFERFYQELGARDANGGRLGFVTEPNPVE